MAKNILIENNMTIRDKANCCIAKLTLPAIVETNYTSLISTIGVMYSEDEAETIYKEIRILAPNAFPPEQQRLF